MSPVARTGIRHRCREFFRSIQMDVINGDGNTVDAIVDFVTSEIGRAADESLEDCAPLVLYFGTDADRQEFLDAVAEAKPNMISRRWPR